MSDSTYTHKQLTIDYSLLSQAATDIKGLSPEISRIKKAVRSEGRATVETVPGLVNDNNPDLGPDNKLYRELGMFYAKWRTDMSNAMDALDKMAGYFKGVADSFMETDASQASGLNLSALMSAVLTYPTALDQWYTDKANAEHAHKDFTEPKPTAPTSPFHLADGSLGTALQSTNNATTTFTTMKDTNVPSGSQTTHAPNLVLSSETTTDNVDGQSYSETTTYQADQGWSNGVPTQNTTQTIHNPDGSTDTVTTTTDTSGHGTMTDYNSSTKDTTTYTRADWKSDWVDTTPKDTSSDDSGDSGPDAAPFVN